MKCITLYYQTAYRAVNGCKFFEWLLSLKILNDAIVGEINHLREFYRFQEKHIFTMNANNMIFFKYEKSSSIYLLSQSKQTKIIKLHQTYKIVCLIMLLDGVQPFIMINILQCGTSKMQCALDNCRSQLTEQLNRMPFDSQYFDLSVYKNLQALVKMSIMFSYFLYGT